MTLSITTLSITTLSIMKLSLNDIQSKFQSVFLNRCTETIPNYSSANHEGAIGWGNLVKSKMEENK
jgi:hypothetical protein